jgi:hypothetical protein
MARCHVALDRAERAAEYIEQANRLAASTDEVHRYGNCDAWLHGSP